MKKKLMVLSVLGIMAVGGVSVHAMSSNTALAVKNSYAQIIRDEYNYGDKYNCYYMYDINKDNMPELIIRRGKCEAEYMYDVYTYTSEYGCCYEHTLPGGHSVMASYYGKGIVVDSAHQGGQRITLYTVDSNWNFYEKVLFSGEVVGDYYYPSKFAKGSALLDYCMVNDSSYMTYNVNSYIGKPWVIGSVLNTNIHTYINGCEIPCYNINNKCVVKAEDLAGYGFGVIWNDAARQLTIQRENKSGAPVYCPSKGKTGSFYANILDTDITVKSNYNGWSAGISSFSVNGYTYVPVEDVIAATVPKENYSIDFNNSTRNLNISIN